MSTEYERVSSGNVDAPGRRCDLKARPPGPLPVYGLRSSPPALPHAAHAVASFALQSTQPPSRARASSPRATRRRTHRVGLTGSGGGLESPLGLPPYHDGIAAQRTHCARQWLRHHPCRLRGRRPAQVLLPLVGRPPQAPARARRRPRGRRLHRPKGRHRAARAAQDPLPPRARHRHRLGRHGAHMGVRLWGGPQDSQRRAPRPLDRAAPESPQQPRHGRPNPLRDVQRARPAHVHPGRPVAVRQRADHGHRPRLGRRRVTRGARVRGLRHAEQHPPHRRGRARRDRVPADAAPQERLRLPHERGKGGGAAHQGERRVRGARPPQRREGLDRGQADGEQVCRVHAARRAPAQDWRGALPGPRDPLRPGDCGARVRRGAPDGGGGHQPHRPGPAQVAVQQHCALGRQHPHQGLRRPAAGGAAEAGGQGHEDQDLCAARAQVLDVDRRKHPGGAEHVSQDVGERRRLAREPGHHPHKVYVTSPPAARRKATMTARHGQRRPPARRGKTARIFGHVDGARG